MKLFTSWRFSLLSTFVRTHRSNLSHNKVSYSSYICPLKVLFREKDCVACFKGSAKVTTKSFVLRSRYISVLYHILSRRNIMPWDIFLFFLLWTYKNSYRARCCAIWLLNNYNRWNYPYLRCSYMSLYFIF